MEVSEVVVRVIILATHSKVKINKPSTSWEELYEPEVRVRKLGNLLPQTLQSKGSPCPSQKSKTKL